MSNAEKMVRVPRDPLSQAIELCKFTLPEPIYFELREALSKPAEQNKGEPVALPFRMPEPANGVWHTLYPMHVGWNACLDEIAKLWPIYTRAHAGEVERLRERINELESHCKRLGQGDAERYWEGRWRDAESELSKRDTLLRDAGQLVEFYLEKLVDESAEPEDIAIANQVLNDIKDISASAEPSAPVERDEREQFERSIIRDRTNEGYSDVALTSILDRGSNGSYQSTRVAGAWEGWQARAALEHKP